jgi:hypothetical protein
MFPLCAQLNSGSQFNYQMQPLSSRQFKHAGIRLLNPPAPGAAPNAAPFDTLSYSFTWSMNGEARNSAWRTFTPTLNSLSPPPAPNPAPQTAPPSVPTPPTPGAPPNPFSPTTVSPLSSGGANGGFPPLLPPFGTTSTPGTISALNPPPGYVCLSALQYRYLLLE